MSLVPVDPEVLRIGMLVAKDVSIMDTANTFETEGLLEYLYTLVSMGEDLAPIATQLRMPLKNVEMAMHSSSSRRKRYLEATMTELAKGSVTSLAHFKKKTTLSKEETAAAAHHRGMVDGAAKLMTTQNEQDAGPKVIVNNTVVIGEQQEPPPLPKELQGVVLEHVNP